MAKKVNDFLSGTKVSELLIPNGSVFKVSDSLAGTHEAPTTNTPGAEVEEFKTNTLALALPESLCTRCVRNRGAGLPDTCRYYRILQGLRGHGVFIQVHRCASYWACDGDEGR